MRTMSLLNLLLEALLFLIFLQACNQVPIKNEQFFANKGMKGAVTFNTLDSKSTELTFEQWMKLLRDKPLVCESVETFGDIKAAVEKLCSVCSCCDYQTKAAMEQFFTNVQKATAK